MSENLELVKKYYENLIISLEKYEKQVIKKAEEFEKSGAEANFFTLGSEQVPLGIAVVAVTKLLRRPKYQLTLVGFCTSLEVMCQEVRNVEEFLLSLPGIKLPKCPEPVDKWLGKKRFNKEK